MRRLGVAKPCRPFLPRLDLPLHQPADRRLERGEPAERLAHGRDLVDAVRLADAAGDADDQAHLGPEADVGVVVLVAVGRRLDVDAARHRGVVVQEDALPGDLHPVAHQHAVGLVEAVGQRIVRLVARVSRVGLARPQRQARRVERQRRGDRLAPELVGDRREVADQDLVGIDRAGGEHLHARHRDAGGILGDHLQVRVVARLPGKQLGRPHAGRRRHREAEIEVVAARMLPVAREVVAEPGVQLLQHRRVHRQPGDQPGDLLGRAADESVGRVRARLERPHAPLEVVAGAAAQPLQAVALAVLLVGEEVALRRIGLEVVELGDRLRALAERRMRGDVVDPLGADVDGAAVAHALELLLPGGQHFFPILTKTSS